MRSRNGFAVRTRSMSQAAPRVQARAGRSPGGKRPPVRLLPAAFLAGVLLLQPGHQRGEVLDDGVAAHAAVAGDRLEGVWPGFAGAHGEHRLEALARLLAAEDRAGVQRAGVAGLLAQCAVKL